MKDIISNQPGLGRGAFGALFLVFTMGCAAASSTGASTAVPQALADAQGTPAVPEAAVREAAAYILQKGDEIEIKAYNIPELNQLVRIRPDGKISLMLLNDVQAAGFTAERLGGALSGDFSKYYRNPRISVVVRSFSSMSVYVGGEVLRPGLVPLRGDVTALQAVLEAGGLKETSRASTVTLLRLNETGMPQAYTLNVNAILSNQAPDVRLRASDVLYVPKSNISVYVGGEVTRPGLLPLNGELTVTAAVFQAGGMKDTAKSNTVMLVRNNGSNSPAVLKLRLDEVIKGKPDTVLQPFDIVYVPRSRIAKIDRFVDQYIRQVIPINIAGGFSYILGGTLVH